jgi:beta-galactosidase
MNNQFLYDWSIYPLPLDHPNAAPFQPLEGPFEQQDRPTFYRGEFLVDDIGDTFIRLDGWGKGVVWVNGFNLGRYWEQGPQAALYLPGPLLKQGRNEILVFELHHTETASIELVDTPDLG